MQKKREKGPNASFEFAIAMMVVSTEYRLTFHLLEMKMFTIIQTVKPTSFIFIMMKFRTS